MAEKLEEVAKSLVEAMNSGRFGDFQADDIVYTAGGPARGSRYEGKEAAVGAGNRAVNQVFLVDKLEVKHALAAKDVMTGKDFIILPISVRGKSRITGRDYANELCLLLEMKDGKIVHMHEYLDTMASARATGDIPYPD